MASLSQLKDAAPETVNFKLDLRMGYGKISPIFVQKKFIAKNTEMRWFITPDSISQVSTGDLLLSFSSFNLDKSNDGSCKANIIIYGSNSAASDILYQGCDQPERWIYVSNRTSLIVFKNGQENLENVNFEITWSIDTPKLFCGSLYQQTDNLVGNSMVLFDGSQSNQNMRKDEKCQWLINPLINPKNNGKIKFQIDWISFELGASINVYDGADQNGIAFNL